MRGARPLWVRVGGFVVESRRGVVVGSSKLRLGSMRFSGPAAQVRRIVALVHCFGDERRGFVADVTILAARITDACAWSLAIRFITRSIKHYPRYIGIKRPKRLCT
jgi:hypothetical protein